MKFWPEKKWKQMLLISIIIVVLIVASASIFVLIKANSDFASELKVLNPNGSQTALVIYHPGLSSFNEDMTFAFGDGLVDNGWRVEITTASDQAPTDLSKYSLLVLGSPVYGGSPSASIKRHVERIGDLGGIESVLVVTSGGINAGAEVAMQQIIEDNNGVVKTVLSLQTGDSLDVAKEAGLEIFPLENN
ncbi:MAG: hypothetical protein KGD70_13455 [Candidatus Lokiarchaeota archaeon]|nr:hypothetical protein [Candidatus Lokiarchaeota archaeon]